MILILTDVCSMSCKYCFYSDVLVQKRQKLIEEGKIDKNTFYFDTKKAKGFSEKINDALFQKNNLGNKTLAISGGEPTLHPDFIEIVQHFIKKKLNIHLLSNFSFPINGKIFNFIKKNIKHFKFLVNLNEISEQPVSQLTIDNLIALDDEKIKIGLNIFHENFNFDHVLKVLNETKNIKIIRIGLPNPQIDEGISMGVLKKMKELYPDVLELYKKDLLENDLKSIKETGQGVNYGLKDKKIETYYKKLGMELSRFCKLLEKNNLSDRVEFYVDCGFDYKILPDDATGYILKRLNYKNPCSIPNGDIQIGGKPSQCYTLQSWGDWTSKNKLTSYKFSLREIQNYYTMSSKLLANGLLHPNLKFEMCRSYSVRLFMQLFTKGKNGTGRFQIGDSNIMSFEHYPLKDLKELCNKYWELYKKNNKEMGLIRIEQLIEFLISHFEFEKAKKIINKYIIRIRKIDKNHYSFRMYYYNVLNNFALKIIKSTKNENYKKIEEIREKFQKELDSVNILYNETIKSIPKGHLKILNNIVKEIIQKWIYIE